MEERPEVGLLLLSLSVPTSVMFGDAENKPLGCPASRPMLKSSGLQTGIEQPRTQYPSMQVSAVLVPHPHGEIDRRPITAMARIRGELGPSASSFHCLSTHRCQISREQADYPREPEKNWKVDSSNLFCASIELLFKK